MGEFLQYLKGSKKKGPRAYIRRPTPGDVMRPLKSTKYGASPSKFDWASFDANEEEVDRSRIVGEYVIVSIT